MDKKYSFPLSKIALWERYFSAAATYHQKLRRSVLSCVWFCDEKLAGFEIDMLQLYVSALVWP